MHILQFINSLCSGGAEKFVVDLSNELIRQGHQVTLVTFNQGDKDIDFNRQFLDERVKSRILGIPQKFRISGIAQFEAILKDTKPDIVHGHLNVLPYMYRAALLNRNIKFVHTLHGLADKRAPKFQRVIDRWFYKKELFLPVTISEQCLKSYQDYFGLTNGEMIVNGRAEAAPSSDFENVKNEIDSYKKNGETKVFITVARCNPLKNQQMLVESFNQLYEEGVNCILLVVGNHFNDTELGKKLQDLAKPNIHFLGEKANVTDYLMCSDFFSLTSLHEGLPISLLEALSCRVTPVCTPVGGIPDVVTEGVTGFLSTSISKTNYVESLKKAMNTPIDKDNLSKLYDSGYSMRKCAAEYIKVYKSAFEGTNCNR